MLRPTYPITTSRLVLRPFAAGDLDDLHAYQSRPDVHRFLYSEPRARDEVADLIERRAAETTLDTVGDRMVLAVVRLDGRLIGEVSLTLLPHRTGEFGFVFHPDHHGHGYAGEAATEMLRLGFQGAGLHRIIGRADGRNAASARLMGRLGMRREAHFVKNEFVKGEWTDEVVYAMLASEWAEREPQAIPVRVYR